MKKSLVLLLVLALMAMGAVLVACGEEATTDDGGTTGGDDGGGATMDEVAMSVLANPQGYPADPSMTPELGGTANMIFGMSLTNFGMPWGHQPGPKRVCVPSGLRASGDHRFRR